VTAAWSDADRRFMREALRLAERGRGATKPNPVVGALLVNRGKVLARGYHRRAGLPHAEVEALAQLGMRAPGATLYVTVEPCCHRGRTGPVQSWPRFTRMASIRREVKPPPRSALATMPGK